MKKVAIIGGGIIGLTAASYLDKEKFQVTVFDEDKGQATKASAGIISPWLSKRRNKTWYQLAKTGAHFYGQLVNDLHLDETIYKQVGTLIIRPEDTLNDLQDLAETRKEEAPEIGEVSLLSPLETSEKLPLLKPQSFLFVSGGGRLDGKAFISYLTAQLQSKGVTFIHEKVTLKSATEVETSKGILAFDEMILTVGPHLKEILTPLGYAVDVRPQKGQLLAFETDFQESGNWPVVMLDGEADLIPFENGKILLGATHENEAGWDLTPTKEAYEKLVTGTEKFFQKNWLKSLGEGTYQIGTRAYTSDFAPFFGEVTPHLLAASGLGSSGLTTGPFIGYLFAHYLNTGKKENWHLYTKELTKYITH